MGCKCSLLPFLQRQRRQVSSTASAISPNNTSASSSSSSRRKAIRVIHMNGHVEDLLPLPATETIVTPRHVVGMGVTSDVLFSSTQLRSMGMGSLAPLPLDDALRPDDLYFLLPSSLFQSNYSSPLDLPALSSRLTALSRDPSTPVHLRHVGPTPPDRGGAVLLRKGRTWKPDLDAIQESHSGSLSRSSINVGSIDPLLVDPSK